jgi:threonylcarbamoyladenosine tRNA methylthiotransferase MtaB
VKYSVITFGCRVNQSDSLEFEEQLRLAGAEPASPELADLVVVNTCSVTASADQGARQTIRRIARVNPAAKIVATGCYATRRPGDLAELPNVTRVVANDDKPHLLSLMKGIRLTPAAETHEPTTVERFGDGEGGCGAAIEPGVAGRTAYTLRVQTGCDEACSYCIIPETRGAPRSRPLDQVLSEAERVVGLGFKEVALTGVHLGSYGRDLAPRRSLLELLQALRDQFEGEGTSAPRALFRISSLEPMDCPSDLVDLIARSRCLAPHFHLPLQHASARMLAAMQRPYGIEQYEALAAHIHARMPHASIGTDLIVGFPGEADADVDLLADYLERSPLTHLHVFPYSDRPGTVASMLGNRPDGTAVKARGKRVRDIGTALNRRFVESQVGAVHRALTLEDGSTVVTGNYLKVRIPPGHRRNEWVTIRIDGASPTLTGEVVERPAQSA